jgi:hypothetical protein
MGLKFTKVGGIHIVFGNIHGIGHIQNVDEITIPCHNPCANAIVDGWLK